jgi:hypothetical protein
MMDAIRSRSALGPVLGTTLALALACGPALAQAEPSPGADPSPIVPAGDEPDGSPSAAFPTATTGISAVAIPLGQQTGPLEPGTYVDDTIGVDVRFTVGEGWEVSGEPIEEVGTELSFPGVQGAATVTITRYTGEAFAEPCFTGEDVQAYLEDTITTDVSAQAFIEQLSANPFLTVEEPTEVEVGGVPGLQADLTVSIPAEECPDQVTYLWPLPEVQEFHLVDGESARIVALDVGTSFVPVMFIEAYPDVDWPAFLEEAMAVVETMEFGVPAAA